MTPSKQGIENCQGANENSFGAMLLPTTGEVSVILIHSDG